jgi:hypothetical protein
MRAKHHLIALVCSLLTAWNAARAAEHIVVNELMASNAGMVMSPAINFDSWIELYNPTEQAVNLAGMYLSDDAGNLTRWKMPSNMGTIPSKGFFVVWLGSDDIRKTQAPFKLDCDGGTICLSDKNGQLITSMDYPEAMSRTAYARTTDGGEEWGWTAKPTPGASNATSVFATERLPAPVVNRNSMLFTGKLTVKVDIPEGATLMYTTDGSLPTATAAENSASQRSVYGVLTVTQTTSYVFRLFKDGYLPSVPVTRSYILTSNRFSIPVVSIVGDKKYFSDPKIGIDCEGDGTNGKTGNGQDVPRNYNMPWDRPVNFSYIGPDGEMAFNQDVNISVSGGWSRSYSVRSFKLKGSKVFDGQNHFDFPFFAQKPYIRSKTLLLRNGGNDTYLHHSRFMDPALHTVVHRSGIDLDVQAYEPVVEYVNGRCRGILNLREANNDKFVYANFGYDDEEIDMFENADFKLGDNVVFNRIVELGSHINDAGAYEELKLLLDIDEFTNYMAVQLFLANDDWPNNNVKGYRSRHDGRFRFILFDLDTAFGQLSSTKNPFSRLDNHTGTKFVRLFLNLLGHSEYRKKFTDAFCLVAGSVFDKTRVAAIIDELADRIRPVLQQVSDSYKPDDVVGYIKMKLETQRDEMTSCMQQFKYMNLSGVSRQHVTLAADVSGAAIFVNGMEVPYAAFSGPLYAPVTLEAKAPAGYTFTGWRQLTGSSVQLLKTNDTWKYYDKGQLPADNWQTASYNDGSWASGQAPLGYNMTGVKTTIGYGSDSQKKYSTTYFRKIFTLSAEPKADDSFELDYQVDDGCVVWVNGKEAGRVNMPGGTVGYDTFSSTYAGSEPLTGTLSLSPSLFKKGVNLIAVEVHNTSYTSSDLFWACELFTSAGTTSSDSFLAEPVIDLPEGSKISLTACFTPMSDAERQAQGLTPVRINEVSAANGIYVNDYFKRNDWIELYNTTDEDVDVEGMYLSDNPEKPKKFQITKPQTSAPGSQCSTVIPAHGYLIVWCDKLEPLSQLHASFKLDASGGDVLLTAADESWSDRISYPSMSSDESVGRYPDGHQQVVTMNVPTIAKANITGSYATEVIQPDMTGVSDLAADGTAGLSLRHVAGRLVVRSTLPVAAARMDIFSLDGRMLSGQTVDLVGSYAELSLDGLTSGCYIARLSDGNGHTATCKFIKK